MGNGHFSPTITKQIRYEGRNAELQPGFRPTVFVVDDDDAARESLAWLIESIGFAVETYDTAEAFLAAFDPGRPGCALADVRLPGMSGIALQKVLANQGAVLPLIIITGYADVPMAVNALKHGAFDFIEKPYEEETLVGSVRQAVARDQELRQLSLRNACARERLAGLSPREREVLSLVMDGAPSKVIACDLRISQKTVEAHRARIMQKMQADSLAKLIRLGLSAES